MNSSEREMEKPVYNPHDEAFKLAFRKILLARSFFRNHLPEKIRQHIDFDKLEISNKSFVDEKLREKHSDIVYRARIKGRLCFLYILFEHQSTPDHWMVFRLLCYIINIWKEYLDQHPKARLLPMIFPLVLYHGKADWNSPMRLRDLVEGDDDFSEFIPDFTYELFNLGDYDDEMLALGDELALSVVLYLFKHIFDDEMAGMFRKMLDLLSAIKDQSIYLEFLEWALRYTYHARNESEEDIRKIIDRETERLEDKRLKEKAMTIAEQIRERGRQEGWQEGRQDGRQEGISFILIKQLKRRFGDVPPTLKQKLGQSKPETLGEFGDSIFDFKNVSDAEKWWEIHQK